MSLSEYVDYVQRKYVIIFPCFVTTCLIKAGGFLFGKIAPMVERQVEALRGGGSSPSLSIYRKVAQLV